MSDKTSTRQAELDISRDWDQYMAKATVSEKAAGENGLCWPELPPQEIETYRKNLAPNFETRIYLWPNPVLTNIQEVMDILTVKRDGKTVRIYPPFPVNEQSETAGAFADIQLPEGSDKIERAVDIPSSALRGLRMEHGVREELRWCRGFRLDVENGADGLSILKLLLGHIGQYTHQWWLRASHNPMLGPLRMGATIRKDFKIVSELRYRGAGEIESTFYGAVQYQPGLGFGSPLTRGSWLLSFHHTQEGRRADQGLLAFQDGIADYMAGEDHKAILNLCIATEIMLSKHGVAVLKRQPSKLEKALRTTQLVDKETRDILKKLVTDRNSVAHGREPYIIAHDERYSIVTYIQAVCRLVNAYLAAMPLGDWPQVMDLRLQSRRAGDTA